MRAFSVERHLSLSLISGGYGLKKPVLAKGIPCKVKKVHGRIASMCELTGQEIDILDVYPPDMVGDVLHNFELFRSDKSYALGGDTVPEDRRAVAAEVAVLVPKKLYVFATGYMWEYGKLTNRSFSNSNPIGGYSDIILFMKEGDRAILMPESVWRKDSSHWRYGINTVWPNVWEIKVENGIPVIQSQAEIAEAKKLKAKDERLAEIEASERNEIQ